MDIIDNGVELNDEEFVQFFDDHCVNDSLTYYVGDRQVGSITAVTADNRLVLAMAVVELYSAKYTVVAVTLNHDGNYTVRIVC